MNRAHHDPVPDTDRVDELLALASVPAAVVLVSAVIAFADGVFDALRAVAFVLLVIGLLALALIVAAGREGDEPS